MKYLQNKNSQLIRGQAFRIVAVIEKLAFHSGPHAFTSSIIVAPATITVHALYNAIFRKRLTVGFTGILSSSVGVHNGTSQIRMRQIGIIQCMLTQSCLHVCFHCQSQNVESKQSKMAETYSFPSLP